MKCFKCAASWSEWESQECSVTCGIGIQKYIRNCVGAGECIGNDYKFELCEDLPECGKNKMLKWYFNIQLQPCFSISNSEFDLSSGILYN